VKALIANAPAFNPAGLQSQIGDLDNRVDALEEFAADASDRIARANRRASSGTAAAMAMGGAVIFPDSPLTFTGGFSTYEGAYAAALQVNAMIAPKAAVNIGVAKGFNKEGKTGARVAFSFGL
jgi:hypothetical protein